MNDPGNWDGGLQLERTILAWRRSALTAACLTVLAARGWINQPCGATLATAAFNAFTTGVLAWGAGVRTRAYRTEPQKSPAVIPLVMLCASVSLIIGGISVLAHL